MPDVAERKVTFGLTNVHYAKITYGTDGTPEYGTPVRIPGGVSLSVNPNGSFGNFYADNTAYYVSYSNTGGTGDLSVADVPEKMLVDIYGYTLGETSKVLTENADAEPKHFALLFQIDNDKNNDFYALYDVVTVPPGISTSTNTDSKTPNTASLSMTYVPRPDGKAKARTTQATPAETRSTWFTEVFVEENPT